MKINKEELKSKISLIRVLRHDLESGKTTTTEIKEKLKKEEVNVFLDNFIKTIKRSIVSEKIIQNVGLPLWSLPTLVPGFLFYKTLIFKPQSLKSPSLILLFLFSLQYSN